MKDDRADEEITDQNNLLSDKEKNGEVQIKEDRDDEETTEEETLLSNEGKTVSKNDEEDALEGLPIDKGWAWVILFAATFEVFIYGGILKSYGLFFVKFQERFGSSASRTTLIQMVANLVSSVSGIFVSSVWLNHVTARTSVCIGTVLSSGCYVISAFSNHFEVLIFTLGAVAGVAATMIYLPILNTIGIYFNKRRGLANSITVAGASLGGLVFGPMYTAMFDYYSYSGTMFISSGILLNILISGCLMRPPEFYTKRKKKVNSNQAADHELEEFRNSQEVPAAYAENGVNGEVLNDKSSVNDFLCGTSTEVDESIQKHSTTTHSENGVLPSTNPGLEIDENAMNSPTVFRRMPHLAATEFRMSRSLSHEPRSAKETIPSSPLQQTVRSGTQLSNLGLTTIEIGYTAKDLTDIRSSSKVLFNQTTDIMYGSLVSLNIAHTIASDNVHESDAQVNKDVKETNCLLRAKAKIVHFLRTVFDLALLKDLTFIHYLLLASVALPTSIMTNMYLIPLAKDIGIQSKETGVLLSVIGCIDLVSRVCVGVLADRKYFKPTTIVAVALTIIAILNNLTRFVQGFKTMIVLVVIQASLAGVYIALFAVILIEHIGMSKFKNALGFTGLFHGGSVATFFPLTGFLRDSSGAYYWTYHMLSILSLLGAILAFTLPMTYRRTRNNAKELVK